jgi:hypothetical protein
MEAKNTLLRFVNFKLRKIGLNITRFKGGTDESFKSA